MVLMIFALSGKESEKRIFSCLASISLDFQNATCNLDVCGIECCLWNNRFLQRGCWELGENWQVFFANFAKAQSLQQLLNTIFRSADYGCSMSTISYVGFMMITDFKWWVMCRNEITMKKTFSWSLQKFSF